MDKRTIKKKMLRVFYIQVFFYDSLFLQYGIFSRIRWESRDFWCFIVCITMCIASDIDTGELRC